MEHLDIIIQVLIVGIATYLFFGQGKKINVKLDKVLINQEDQRVKIAEIKKDVQSNKQWGMESKSRLDELEREVHSVTVTVAELKARISK